MEKLRDPMTRQVFGAVDVVRVFRIPFPRNKLHGLYMMCSGPFFGAQGHSSLQTRRERRSHMDWKRGEVASEANCFRLTFPE